MTEKVTLELPFDLAQRVRAIAAGAHQPVEELLVQWVNQVAAEPPVESLTDEEILAICDSQLSSQDQEELSSLLANSREQALSANEQLRLDALIQRYRLGLVRKGKAWKVAVERKLRAPLN